MQKGKAWDWTLCFWHSTKIVGLLRWIKDHETKQQYSLRIEILMWKLFLFLWWWKELLRFVQYIYFCSLNCYCMVRIKFVNRSFQLYLSLQFRRYLEPPVFIFLNLELGVFMSRCTLGGGVGVAAIAPLVITLNASLIWAFNYCYWVINFHHLL